MQQYLNEAFVFKQLKGKKKERIIRCFHKYEESIDTPYNGTYHVDWHVELRQGQVAIAQHGVIREMHLHAVEQRAYDVIAQQCAKLGTIATLNNVEQCCAGQGGEKEYITVVTASCAAYLPEICMCLNFRCLSMAQSTTSSAVCISLQFSKRNR